MVWSEPGGALQVHNSASYILAGVLQSNKALGGWWSIAHSLRRSTKAIHPIGGPQKAADSFADSREIGVRRFGEVFVYPLQLFLNGREPYRHCCELLMRSLLNAPRQIIELLMSLQEAATGKPRDKPRALECLPTGASALGSLKGCLRGQCFPLEAQHDELQERTDR